ncbi:hypothetical protein P8452_69328 [Trifolium repens]|nr:hypothetical protein P8452_69328 [Trifolium repens]
MPCRPLVLPSLTEKCQNSCEVGAKNEIGKLKIEKDNGKSPMIEEVNSLDFEAGIAHVVEDRSKTLSVGAKGKGRQPNHSDPAKKESIHSRPTKEHDILYKEHVEYRMEIPRFSIVLYKDQQRCVTAVQPLEHLETNKKARLIDG